MNMTAEEAEVVHGPETAKMVRWFDQEKAAGMVDFKVNMNPDRKPCSVEELSAELNRMIEAPVVPGMPLD